MSYRPKTPGEMEEPPSVLGIIGAVLLIGGLVSFFAIVSWGLYQADRQTMQAIFNCEDKG